MKNRKVTTRRVYPACALLVAGVLLLWGAVQAAPTSPQMKANPASPQNRPSPSPSPQDVNVVNPISNPVSVRDVDNPVRRRFQAQLSCSFNGSNNCSAQITVPDGKELIIEFVFIAELLNTSQMAYPARLDVGQGGTIGGYTFPVPLQIDDGANAYFVGVHQTRLYADPSNIVRLNCFQVGTSFGVCEAEISGYLVDVP
jgi:hypothetical protein